MDIQQEVENIEGQLMDLIIKHLEENKTTEEDGRKLAQAFLAELPVTDQQDLLNKLKELSAQYNEAKTVYAVELAKVDEMKREDILSHMRNAIHSGDINTAISVAKAYTGKKE